MISPFLLDRETYLRYECGGEAPEYPLSTAEAAREIQIRGLRCDFIILNSLIRSRRIAPERYRGRNFGWTPEDIDAAMELLQTEPACLLPFTVTLMTINITAGEFCRAYHRAEEQLRSEYSSDILGDDRVSPLEFDWTIESRRPARSSISMKPSKTLIARLESALESQKSNVATAHA